MSGFEGLYERKMKWARGGEPSICVAAPKSQVPTTAPGNGNLRRQCRMNESCKGDNKAVVSADARYLVGPGSGRKYVLYPDG